jgi:acyl dehydratase
MSEPEASDRLPRALAPVRGPLPEGLPERAVRSLGPEGKACGGLLASGIVPPNALTGMTLALIAGQPRREQPAGSGGSTGSTRPGPIAGGVWVREQITYHRPVRLGEELEIQGEMARRFTRNGRRYSTTTSETRRADGKLVVSSCTTGLVRYRRDPDLPDAEEGRAEADLRVPGPDPARALANPSRDVLLGLRAGARLAGPRTLVSLERMRALHGERPNNPIHTDPEAARAAGLDAPIAAGAQVLAFCQELLMQAWGAESLLHGAHFDVRWVSPVRAGTHVEPHASVRHADATRVLLDLEVACEGQSAMLGTLELPLSAAG